MTYLRSPLLLIALAACLGWVAPARGQSVVETKETSPGASPLDDGSGPPLQEIRLLPFRPLPGWFASVDAALLRTLPSPAGSFMGGGSEPVNDLGLNVSPQGSVGYHFAGGNALLASYRFLSASGTALAAPDQAHASFIYHTLDLDYQGRIHGPLFFFTCQWQAGIRFDSVRYDTDRTLTGQHFLGAGPHAGLNLAWYAGYTGVNLFTRGDVGILFGSTTGAGTSDALAGNLRLLNARAEMGLGWVLPTQRWMRCEGGYLFDDFNWAGHVFTNFGPFLRYEVGF